MLARLPRRVRGVALLMVLVVLVLIATLATEIAITAKMHHTLSEHSMDGLLLRTAVDGRMELLKAALRYDGTNGSGVDGEADEWAYHNTQKLSGWGERAPSSFGTVTVDAASAGTTFAFKNTDVQIQAWCEDERSKLNLRGLMKPEESDVFKNTRDTLIRLIDLYRETYSGLDLSDGDAKDMVDDLVKWLQAESDTQDNPMPAVKPNRGRLQSVDDLLRVPGGHWTASRLYDVKDPNAVDDSDPASTTSTTSVVSSTSSTSSSDSSDSTWEWQNGVPGLWRYLTVFAETTAADPPLKININTAPTVLLKALFDQNDEDFAEKIVEQRRNGGGDAMSSAPGSSPTDTSGTSGSTTTDPYQNYFKTKQDLSAKIEGMDKDLAKYPRLNFFADVSSPIYSMRVIAKIGRGGGANTSSSTDATGDDAGAPKEVDAVYQYRQVVQRTNAGILTLFTECRSVPLLAAATQ